MMDVFTPGLAWYANKISKGEHFSLVRYGNGEWDCILGTKDRTGSGSQRLDIPTLKRGLENSILKPHSDGYYYAMQSLSYLSHEKLLPQIETWLRQHNVHNIKWHSGEVFHRASGARLLAPLVKQLWKRPVIIVGPKWLSKLPFAKTFIEVIPKDCWKDLDATEKRLQTISAGTVVSFSAGPTAKVLIHRLFPILGKTCWLLDFGSLWDPYCGVFSRSYHRRMRDVSPDTLRVKSK